MNKFLKFLLFIFLFVLITEVCLAAQDAIVIVKKAVIYSDLEMTGPIGYVSRGKKIKIGEVPRNNAQLYPIIVSGKVAYIKVQDVSTEKEDLDTDRLSVERFTKATKEKYKERVTLNYYKFASQISLGTQNGDIKDKDAVNWDGVSLKGEVGIKKKWDLSILLNYMWASVGEEKFTAVELGAGGHYRLIETEKFLFRLGAEFLAIPFSNYSIGQDFRVNGYGYSAGAGFNLSYLVGENVGLEGFGGMYYTKITSLDPPKPYGAISPVFTGSRLGVGLYYQY
ncbi:MAG: hypothetical protein AB7I27_11550 [Bacteriovoracaceae bacterium]